ncbi:MAG: hypothetical protein NTV58_00765 [Deltaproteobacteria bacterium]|nr:hypothetical protein [Deltaproteobacteria bacterium]
MDKYLFAAVQLILILALWIDWIFLARSGRRAWMLMLIGITLLSLWAQFESHGQILSRFFELEQLTELIIFGLAGILIREVFLSRARHMRLETQMADMVRSLAIRDAKIVIVGPEKKSE